MRPLLYVLLACFAAASSWCAETMPLAPAQYFNDYAAVVSPSVAAGLNRQLEDFERRTSDQIVVAVFQKMQSDSSLEDYTHRVMESWKVGQRVKNNGVGLFVFVADRRTRIEVNYGLEGALPDATCKRIIENEILPRFRNNDYEGGLTAGITAIEQAVRGEYKGSGRSVADGRTRGTGIGALFLFVIIMIVLASIRRRYAHGGTVYGSNGRRMYSGTSFLALLAMGLGGGGSSGGGGGGGGGGGFSGGGGSGGGGGASGSW